MKQLQFQLDGKSVTLNLYCSGISGNPAEYQLGTVCTMRVESDDVYTGAAWLRPDEECNVEMGERKAFGRMATHYALILIHKSLKSKDDVRYLSFNVEKYLDLVKKTKGELYNAFFAAGGQFGNPPAKPRKPLTTEQINLLLEDAALQDAYERGEFVPELEGVL